MNDPISTHSTDLFNVNLEIVTDALHLHGESERLKAENRAAIPLVSAQTGATWLVWEQCYMWQRE
jgi:hypothetical protein